WAGWWSNDAPTLFSARERAFALYRQRHDRAAAARLAIWLGSDHHDFRGDHAVANGWYQRARRLLAELPACLEHGWLAFQEGAYALELAEDTTTALARAEEVSGIGRQLELADLEFLGTGLAGLALVTRGEVDQGMRRLDEVGVAATNGELSDRIARSWMLCYLIYACERVRDFDRASQWCARMQEMSARFAFDLGMGVCRAHYGGVLVFQGQWDLAEAELSAAADILARTRPLAVVESLVRLGELRRRQGRAEEAAELFGRSEPHPLAVVGLASLALDGGEPARAAELLDDLLAMTPGSSLTQRADALELLAKARAALDDEEGTGDAVAALDAIAAAVGTKPLLAMACVGHAAAAGLGGDHQGARRSLERAVELFERSGLPYEAECARIDLARALARLQRGDAADRQARRAATRLRALGALYAGQRAEQAARGELASPPDAASPLAGLSVREMEVLGLLTEGLTDREVGQRLLISAHTAHRHVSNILTKLGLPTRAAAAALAGRHGVGRSSAQRRPPVS
ncbi:MAG: LuxR C-terminal-related transcriptional regulator, partial [Acidimicrobiales bacterium]